MHLAPVSLFVYNRLDHTKKTVDALQKNLLASESNLFIFSDGSKNEKDELKVQAVRDYLKIVSGFKSINILERTENMGLAKSIIAGVTEIVNNYGKIIVLEDDLVTSKYFLKFMNDSLDLYDKKEKVGMISGYIYPVFGKLPETFFIRGGDCWGWATWQRAWNKFEKNGEKLLGELKDKKLLSEFDLGGYKFSKMLENQTLGRNDSWAIRWHASLFLQNMLTLYPGNSLIDNIGLDGSGVHSGKNIFSRVMLANKSLKVETIEVVENLEAKKKINRHLFLLSVFIKIKSILNN